jgi:hypothetical protein
MLLAADASISTRDLHPDRSPGRRRRHHRVPGPGDHRLLPGGKDYLITWREEFVGRVSPTPCRRAGANRQCFAFPKSPSCLRLSLHLPASARPV